MSQLMQSPPIMVAVILLVSVVYTAWLWSRLRIGRYDAIFCSVGIICFQLIAAFTTQNTPLALVATMYHAALVGGVFTASRSLKKADT
jgi:membrane-anchored protein YejM (alkaline phosphatase superfamily)